MTDLDTPRTPSPDAPSPNADADRWRAPKSFPWPPVVIVVTAFVAFSSIMLWRVFGPTNDGPRVINDQAFITAANDTCRRRLPDLRPKVLAKETSMTPEVVAEGSRKTAGELDLLRGELAAIPVSGAEQAAVAGWLENWAKYSDNGRAYADKMAVGDVNGGYKISGEGHQYQLDLDRFSRANGLGECLLATGQKLPARSGL